MNDPSQICAVCNSAPQQMQWLQLVFGAIIAGIGGFFAVVVRLRLETKQEIDYIKISLIDELHEICSVIDKMSETHRTSGNIPQIYFNELSENTESFEQHKPRLFLLNESSIRKLTCDFYKKLEAEIKKSIETVGSLSDGDSQTALANEAAAKFAAIKTEGQTLERKIKEYKYRALYFI